MNKSSVLALCLSLISSVASADWTAKVEPELLQAAAGQERTEFMVQLAEQADLSAAASARSKLEKGRIVVQALKATAARSQPQLLEFMRARGMPVQAFWIANAVSTAGSRADLQALAQRSEVRGLHLLKNSLAPQPLRPGARRGAKAEGEEVITPSLELVGATKVWELGFTGQGVVVGDHDVGVDWEHPALKSKYRGWDGSTANHDYNWLNAFPADPFCDDLAVPCDPHGHGTHTTGTMVGDDGMGTKVGMAPGAQWMACRSLLDPVLGVGTVPTYMTCMEWQIAPYPTGNTAAADPAMAPDVVNNSWGCLEACAPPVLQAANEAIKAAGIVQVASAGNDGSECSTLAFPIGVYESSFTVGATNDSDQMASFSSRGPVLSDASMRVKPNVVAPGVDTLSSLPGGEYGTLSGTSMAGPHVAGLAALILSAEPRLKGRVDEVRHLIEQTSVKIMTDEVCGGTGQDDIPNNIFGFGRIDALAAVLARPQLKVETALTGTTDLVFTVTVSQPAASKLDATGLVVTAVLPEGVTAKSGARQLHAKLAPGESLVTEFQLKASGSGPHDIYAIAEADQVSPVSSQAAARARGLGRFGGGLGLSLLAAMSALAAATLLLRRRRLRRMPA